MPGIGYLNREHKRVGVSKLRLMGGQSRHCVVCETLLDPDMGERHLCAKHVDWEMIVVDSKLIDPAPLYEGRDLRMELTEAEQRQFWGYIQGGQYSGAARRKLFEFAEARGWSDEEREHVTAALRQRFGSGDADPGTDAATSDAAPDHQAPTA